MKLTRTPKTKCVALNMEAFRTFLLSEQFTHEFCDQLHLFFLHDPSVGIMGTDPQALEPSIAYNGNESYVYVEQPDNPERITWELLAAVRQTCHDYTEWMPALDSLERWMLPLEVESDKDCIEFANAHSEGKNFIWIAEHPLEKTDQDQRHKDFLPEAPLGITLTLVHVFALMGAAYLFGKIIGLVQGQRG